MDRRNPALGQVQGLQERQPDTQQLSRRTRLAISWSDGCVYTVVVSGEACVANLCARNRSRVTRSTVVRATGASGIV